MEARYDPGLVAVPVVFDLRDGVAGGGEPLPDLDRHVPLVVDRGGGLDPVRGGRGVDVPLDNLDVAVLVVGGAGLVAERVALLFCV